MNEHRERVIPPLSLEPATELDIPDVWNIINANSDWLVAQGHTHWKNWYTEERVAEKVKKGHQFIARQNGVPVATINMDATPVDYYEPEEMAQFENPTAPALYMSALGVLPEQHGQGVGTQIMQMAEEYALQQGVNLLRFDCKARLTDLVRFYTNLGYQKVGEIIDRSQNHEVYFLMEKEIAPNKDENVDAS